MGLFGRKKEPVTLGTSAPEPDTARVKILGPGCRKCRALEDNVVQALADLGRTEPVGHVTDVAQIAAYGVMSTPALVIDGEVVSSARVLSVEEAAEVLRGKLA